MGQREHGMFEWKDAYAVDIPGIDAQHRRLFQLAEEFRMAVVRGEAQTILAGMLDNLVEYTLVHFADEESLMRLHEYPGLAVHIAEHSALTQRVQQFSALFKQGQTAFTFRLLVFLQHWLETHIMGSDHSYAPYLRSNLVRV